MANTAQARQSILTAVQARGGSAEMMDLVLAAIDDASYDVTAQAGGSGITTLEALDPARRTVMGSRGLSLVTVDMPPDRFAWLELVVDGQLQVMPVRPD